MNGQKGCQYANIIIPVVVSGMIMDSGFGHRVMNEIGQSGIDIKNDQAVNQWFGRKIRWGDQEAARIHRVFGEFHSNL